MHIKPKKCVRFFSIRFCSVLCSIFQTICSVFPVTLLLHLRLNCCYLFNSKWWSSFCDRRICLFLFHRYAFFCYIFRSSLLYTYFIQWEAHISVFELVKVRLQWCYMNVIRRCHHYWIDNVIYLKLLTFIYNCILLFLLDLCTKSLFYICILYRNRLYMLYT